MTPHKYTPGGSFVVDIRIKGIGRIHGATGITREPTFLLYVAALKEMGKDGSGRAWIRALLRKEVVHLDLWAAYKDGRWRSAPSPEVHKQLVPALEQWLKDYAPRDVEPEKSEISKGAHIGRKAMVDRVRRTARDGATIEELPEVLREIKRQMLKHGPTFNLHRNYVRSFVRDTFGQRHELYQVIKYDIGAIKIPGHAKRKEKKRHPLTPAQVLLLASKFPTRHPGGAEGAEGHGYNAIGMTLLGTNPKEWFVDGFTQGPMFVKVHGEKRDGRERMVPKLFPSKLWPHAVLKGPTITQHSFARVFAIARKAAGLKCTPMDLRRSFANWMVDCGIEPNRRRIYRGHNPKDVGDMYETPELLAHLVEDGRRMVEWINRQLELAQRPQLLTQESR